MALAGVVAQRVLARQTIGQLHINVRTGRERRKRATVDVDKLEGADIQWFERLSGDTHMQASDVHVKASAKGTDMSSA
jgi:hypothetical protein